jgi:hypothetical protein
VPGLIDKLLELWKLQGSLQRIKSQIDSTGKCRSLKTRVASITMRKKWSSKILDSLFRPRLLGIEKTVEEMLSLRQYENIVMSYSLLKIMIDKDYDIIVNQTLLINFIKPILSGRFNQFVIFLLVRALAHVVNKEIWKAVLDCKHMNMNFL